ncbi:hypothetical protein QAD02_001428 [Eretmocerus hayati]|uniref:Uncharacterized protein n=1 Tax=Eretmocerus hayati TaxID=131215 RepID=A0ACC2NGE9_9HYME|nr:hypothetical protein QAD02_001428 [Eretmocerus hayati]
MKIESFVRCFVKPDSRLSALLRFRRCCSDKSTVGTYEFSALYGELFDPINYTKLYDPQVEASVRSAFAESVPESEFVANRVSIERRKLDREDFPVLREEESIVSCEWVDSLAEPLIENLPKIHALVCIETIKRRSGRPSFLNELTEDCTLECLIVRIDASGRVPFYVLNEDVTGMSIECVVPFVRTSVKVLTRFWNRHKMTNQRCYPQKHFLQSRKSVLKHLLMELYSAGNKSGSVDASLSDLLVSFASSRKSDPCPKANDMLADSYLSELKRYVFTGTACCGKTTTISMLKREFPNALVRSRGDCGRFADKDANPAAVAGMHAAQEVHFTSRRRVPIGDRGQFDNSLWRRIMMICENVGAERAVDMALDFFENHQNPATVAYFRSFKTFIVLESDVTNNKIRMQRRNQSNDLQRSLIDFYVTAQNVMYYLMAVWFRCEVAFVEYSLGDIMKTDRMYEKMKNYFDITTTGHDNDGSNTEDSNEGFEIVEGLANSEIPEEYLNYEYAKSVGIYR